MAKSWSVVGEPYMDGTVDRYLTLADDGTFTLGEHAHGWGFGFSGSVSGNWTEQAGGYVLEATSGDERICNVRAGERVVAKVDGDAISVNGYRLSRDG